ncbi:MAG: pyridoxamine 5'-phosphate oxidase family protein [Chloroflexi bacterium CFX4]|nr:pyridoxamine 5'-phosphate oxidase family protein [Chloroflexi bacterium CFX4]MDL1921664.1 pyridoxamine 5'-phosphate oxidase family protein [Chloroflexi bacterium CFX3]
MAKVHEQITDELRAWIEQQRLFFVASAPLTADGHINLSPKGHDCLRVLDAHTVGYLDLTGSGNETSAHILENGRLTLMWCAFEGAPRILRLFGRGEVVLRDTPRWAALAPHFPLASDVGARQIVLNHVERVQTSCGFAVPLFTYEGERDALRKWSAVKGEAGVSAYWEEKNVQSIDGLPTPLGQHISSEA